MVHANPVAFSTSEKEVADFTMLASSATFVIKNVPKLKSFASSMQTGGREGSGTAKTVRVGRN